jgi:Arc/MetJ family transcription regulator
MSKTTVDIDQRLLMEAKEITGLKTTKDVVNCALENIVRKKRLHKLAGELRGSGIVELSDKQLDEMRKNA